MVNLSIANTFLMIAQHRWRRRRGDGTQFMNGPKHYKMGDMIQGSNTKTWVLCVWSSGRPKWAIVRDILDSPLPGFHEELLWVVTE